ncbi:hypothetical protein BT67DRAFT_134664 [Trichocladium antarcticum]|uniref:Uncharacterized protein n=1 Tax=Trichocladium antarcticum TaxID=1450529 RepID=A0AAN6UFK3_9PEZI|nr:hypothetical protein BT67DRAFT_134664 [Trichocladium antarcticum]
MKRQANVCALMRGTATSPRQRSTSCQSYQRDPRQSDKRRTAHYHPHVASLRACRLLSRRLAALSPLSPKLAFRRHRRLLDSGKAPSASSTQGTMSQPMSSSACHGPTVSRPLPPPPPPYTAAATNCSLASTIELHWQRAKSSPTTRSMGSLPSTRLARSVSMRQPCSMVSL